ECLFSDLCHCRCACMAGQKSPNKFIFLGFGGKRHGFFFSFPARLFPLLRALSLSLSLSLVYSVWSMRAYLHLLHANHNLVARIRPTRIPISIWLHKEGN
ncbi:unnamed protein product, partial [Prunus brigantina]